MRDDKPTIHALRGQIALWIATTLGLRVFPLIPGGKTPAIANWPRDATTNREQIILWWSRADYNIGICCGATPRINGSGAGVYYVVAVDYDCKPGQLGLEAHVEHLAWGFANTLGQKTPHGIHRIFWADRPVANSQSRLAPNVDIRGHHGYIVGPGSVVEGVEYRWLDDFTEIAPLPEHWYAKLGKADVTVLSQTHTVPVGELDLPAAVERVKNYLINDAEVAHQGSGGDHATFTVAARCKDLGVSEDVCFELMSDWWNEAKADPAWPPEELRTKVRNAYRYGRNPPGSGAPENEFGNDDSTKTDPDKEDDPSTYGKQAREPMVDESFDHAADTALDNQGSPIIEGLLGQGEISAIYGNPESGKTFAALDMCYAIASGAPEWNGRKVTQGGVLYVAAEGGPTIRKRFRAIRTKYGKKNVPMRLLRYPIDMRTGSFDAVRLSQLVKEREQELGMKILLVVIDTLAEALAGGNDTEHMPQFIHNTKIVKNKTGANVLVIHHPGKDTSRGPRGRSDFRGWVDTLIEVFDPKQGEGGLNSRRRFKVIRLRDYELPKAPLWFRLESIDLGVAPNGVKVTSAVAVWCDSAAEEFRPEMTPTERALFSAIERWAGAESKDLNSVTSAPLLAWLEINEPDNKLAVISDAAMRKAISRLRQSGYLEIRDDEE